MKQRQSTPGRKGETVDLHSVDEEARVSHQEDDDDDAAAGGRGSILKL